MHKQQPHVVLVGMPGAGKSTIGQALANALGVDFVDSDELIAAEYGKPCGEVLASVGEPRFREIEQATIAAALQRPGILSLGGGAVVTPGTREALQRHCVVWLHVDLDEGVRRTQVQGGRPLLDGPDPQGRYRNLLEQREQLYAAVAQHTIATTGLSPAEIVGEIQQILAAAE